MRKGLGTSIRVLLGLIALGFLLFAFNEAYDRSREFPVPSLGPLLFSTLLVLIGLAGAARGWRRLVADHPVRGLARGFFVSQLGKYIPGGIWQPAGQLAMAATAGVNLPRASASLPIHMLIQVVAGGSVGAFLSIFATRAPAVIRAIAALGLLLPILLHRTWMIRVLSWLRTRVSKIPSDLEIPSQRNILASFGWSVVTFVFSGAGFAVIAAELNASDPVAAAAPAFAAAWTVGFVAVPVPAGIGVREAVMISAMAAPVANIIAASLFHRLVTMAAELGAIALSWAWGRGGGGQSAPPLDQPTNPPTP